MSKISSVFDLSRYDESDFTLVKLFDNSINRYGEHEAILYQDTRNTYSQLGQIVNNLAKCFIKLGIRKGDKIGIWMPDNEAWIYSFFAISKAGGVIIPLNARYRENDVAYVLKHAEIKIIIVGDINPDISDYAGMLNSIAPDIQKSDDIRISDAQFPDLSYVITVGQRRHRGMLNIDDALKMGEESGLDNELKQRADEVKPDDLCILQYTSGTTAFPKGCMIKHKVITRNSLCCGQRLELEEAKDRLFDPMPPFHVVGLTFGVIPCIASGCCRIGVDHLEPLEALKTMHQEKCTATSGNSTILLSWLDHQDFPKYDVSLLRTGIVFAPLAIVKNVRERLPDYKPINIYGLSEVGGNLTTTHRDDELEIAVNTHGKPHEGMQLKIIDPETGKTLPENSEGEICAKGWSVMEGYYKNPEETAKVIDSDGWFHTGDTGVIEEHGNLIFKGRMKDVIRVGGENVSAAEIEEFLLHNPKVKYVQVVNAPDDRLEEVVAAFIELKDGVESSQEEIIKFCKGKIASFKIPKHVRFVTEWPMSASKVQKFKLKEQITRELQGTA
jgi:fatty-acyl-CoA synthase